MARPIKKDKEGYVEQSNYITTARYDYTPQEKRILYRVVEQAYKFRMQNRDYFDTHDIMPITRHVEFTMQITDFMNSEQRKDPSGKQYQDVVDAFKSLVDKRISFRGKGEFSFGGILNYADQMKGQGTINFMVHRFVWQSALDFTKGFTQLDLIIAMELKSAYSMRFFELAKEFSDTMWCELTIEEFREMFKCQIKYPRLESLKRCVIDVAKKELDKKSPISFNYTFEKKGKKITKFHFTFYELRKNRTEKQETDDLLIKYPNAALSREVKEFLTNKITFTPAELNHNIAFFHEFERTFHNKTINEMEETFQYISKMRKRPQENKGLFIQNLKKKLEWEHRQQDIPFNQDGQNNADALINNLADKFKNKTKS